MIDTMENDFQSKIPDEVTYVHHTHPILQILKKILFILIPILCIFGVLFYFHILDLTVFLPVSNVTTKTAVIQQRSSGTVPISDFEEKCPLGQDAKPMIKELFTDPTRQIGSLRGTVNAFAYDITTKTATLQVISVDGSQLHTFHVQQQDGLVFDNTTQKQKTLTDIAYGQAVELSFQCDANTNNVFTITQISLINH